ncbi:MAG: hypothetical protein PHQ60_02155 [Sideroxydans sp.]|nr:hypothetical protein [Sideroxydans sp.]MDD5056646.1 hypothetical protein [Sideroxydans sp.]
MKRTPLLIISLLMPIIASAGGPADYQAGIEFTKDPTGGQPANGTQGVGQNASNIQNLIKLFITHQDVATTTGADASSTMNAASQSAGDVNILKQYFQQTNSSAATASASLNQPGGRGDQKKQFCLTYTDKIQTPNPDPIKYAECQAVNELNKHPIKDYRANSGFSANDAIFSAGSQLGLAKKEITDTDQSQLLTIVGVGGTPGASSQQCVTVNKISPPQTTTGQCARAAVPDTTPCSMTLTPKVMLEKYCNVSGGPTPIPFFITAPGGTGGIGAYSTNAVGPATIEYVCGTPSIIDGSVTTIIARLFLASGSHTLNGPVSIEFAPGVSYPWTTKSLEYDAWNSCAAFGMGCNWNRNDFMYGISYDGLTDEVNIKYIGMVFSQSSGAADPVGGDTILSCAQGANFVAGSVPYSITTCTTTTTWAGTTQDCVTTTKYAIPARCETPGIAPTVVAVTPTINSYAAKSTWTMDANGSGWTYSCPNGGQLGAPTGLFAQPKPSASTCYIASYGSCGVVPSHDSWSVAIAPGTYDAAGVPTFNPAYCTLQSTINNLHLYAPAPHYTGGAGLRERLTEDVVNSCDALQAQSPDGPAAPGGSYAPISILKNTCPASWTLSISSPSFPSVCQFQPADVPAIATLNYVCQSGGTYNTTSHQCEYQKPSYIAVASKLYTCAVGDTLQGGTCPNGGVRNGDSCLYSPYAAALASQSCISGFYPSGSLCYNDLALAQTITVANGTSVIDSIKTYSCNGTDTLNGTQCEKAAQMVLCDHQPPSVASTPVNHYSCPTNNKTGNYFINYALADNTVWSQACVAFLITKPATLQSRSCDAPYTYNSAADKCEYQMPDYAANINRDCSGSPGYTYNSSTNQCFLVPPTYPAF